MQAYLHICIPEQAGAAIYCVTGTVPGFPLSLPPSESHNTCRAVHTTGQENLTQEIPGGDVPRHSSNTK